MSDYTHETWISPFTWRYGSEEMRALWSEAGKRRIWRHIWVALARAQQQAGLVTAEQVADLEAHQDEIDWERAQEIERDLRHDLMAEVRTYAEQCPVGGAIIHLGATSMDIEDNADALRLFDALALIKPRLIAVLSVLAEQAEREADTLVMAYTHLQPAEPTTVGYRLAQYAYDFYVDLLDLEAVAGTIKGKGFKGAVGTAASYDHLLRDRGMTPLEMEALAMAELGIEAVPVSTQTYPRKMDFRVLNVLASIAQSAYKFAFDLRLLQSPLFGEMSEPFGSKQVGSSAMPFKRNPISSESICSLARYVAGLPRAAWDNAALSALERTLDDSANRRSVLPEAFLAVDEILRRVERIVSNINIGREGITRNLTSYGPFAATEPLLMELVSAGASRQEMHERIRLCSMEAWAAVMRGEANPLVKILTTDVEISAYLPPEKIKAIMAQGADAGTAPAACRELVIQIREAIEEAGQI